MKQDTLADLQRLNHIKNCICAITKEVDSLGRVSPTTLEAAQVRHEVAVLLPEFHIHGLLSVPVHTLIDK